MSFRSFGWLGVVVLSGVISGCSSSSSRPICDRISAARECDAYSGEGYGESGPQGAVETRCESNTGSYSEGTCEPEGRLGRCTFSEGKTFEHSVIYYSSHTSTATSLMATCNTSGGNWRGTAEN